MKRALLMRIECMIEPENNRYRKNEMFLSLGYCCVISGTAQMIINAISKMLAMKQQHSTHILQRIPIITKIFS
uniref:Uncharacterized protein n=1 Tax=Onchocerca volvulus TaxID=6282 RepID=A0A8R1TKH1_ONCVO